MLNLVPVNSNTCAIDRRAESVGRIIKVSILSQVLPHPGK